MSGVSLLFLTATILVASPADAPKLAWTSDRASRVVVRVDPVSTPSRPGDEMVAAVDIDFREHLNGQPCDPASLQVVAYDPQTGEPLMFHDDPHGTIAGERPFRFHDAAIPWDFPEGEGYAHNNAGTGLPARLIPGGGRYLGVVGRGEKGRIVWNHRQAGSRPSWYAIYFSPRPDGGERRVAPAGFVGDGSNLCAPQSPHFFPLYHSRVDVADVDGDGRFDLVAGNMNGTLLWYRNGGDPGRPRFMSPELILTDEGKVLDIGYSSAPKAVDWDRDGDLDLIVGAEKESFVFFRNVGTPHAPSFHLQGLLEVDGTPIRVPRAPCEEDLEGRIFPYDYYPVPEIVDWDGDGDLDLIVGGYITGRIWLYENMADGPDTTPSLAFRGPLQADGKDIDVTWMAAPCAADFDGDGDLDLVSGAMQMTEGGGDKDDPDRFLWYYENGGSRTDAKLTLRPFPAKGRFRHGSLGTPRAADFNGDGRLDLIVSASTDLLMLPNVGSADRPLFDATVPPEKGRWGNLVLRFQQLVGYNADGCVDLLAGEHITLCDPAKPSRYAGSPVVSVVPSGDRIHHSSPRGDHWDYRAMADLDGDGLLDLLVGDHQGHVWFHRDEGTSGIPRIDAAGRRLELTSGDLLRVGLPPTPEDGNDFDELQGARTTISSGDFNRDGLRDLLVGDTYGVIHLFLRAPGERVVFQPGRSLARLVKIRLVAVGTDWNGDGWDDVLATYAGSQTYLLINRGIEGQAEFEEPVEITVPTYPMSWPLLHVADWNGDGDEDLIYHYGTMVRFVERSFIDHGYVQATLVAAEPQPAGASSRAVDPTGLERVVVASSSHHRFNAYPTIARLADGRLMCVFTAKDEKTHDKYVVVAAFSEDHGRTWSKPRVVIDTPGELDFDPSIVVIGRRVLATSTTCPPSHLEKISTSRTMAVASDDNAKHFSAPFEIPMGHRYSCGKINPGLVLEDGTAVFGFSWDQGLERAGSLPGEGHHNLVVSVMRSSDQGRTWEPGGDVRLAARRDEANAGAINGVDEPALVECTDGSLYMLCRTGFDRLYESRSTDGGLTWSAPVPSPLVSHNAPASLCRIAGQRPGLLAVWCNSPKHRWPLCAAASFDDGRTWTSPRVLTNVEGRQSSYPGCAQAADGTLVVVWQQDAADGRREILGARFQTRWLLEADPP